MALPQTARDYYTYADYCRWPEGERWELIDGEAWNMAPAPSIKHQTFVGQLFRQIDPALDGHPCRALIAPVDVLLPSADEPSERIDTVVQPDILVVCDPEKISESHVRGAPDWVIEVLSPATARRDHITKRRLYERAGVREYWLVHPTDGIVTIYRLENGRFSAPEIIEMAGERAPAILPGVLIRWQDILDKLPEASGTPPANPL